VALVSDVPWLRATTSAMSFMIPAEVRLFHLNEQDEAKRWITESAA
jgi:hypothetical protein